ncbi:MAG: Na/Pi symporter [bacterium]
MFEHVGYLIGGIGVFFVGMQMLTAGLKQITGRRLQMLLAKWTGNGFRGGLIGCVAGAVTQSMSGLSFIIASLVSVGMMNVRQALPVICWANAGVGILVLLAFMDIRVVILFILGIAGICYAFEKPVRFRYVSQALLGMGLLFFGLYMIRQGATPLAEMGWFKSLLVQGRESYLLGFVAAALLTGISQSSSAVAILAIAMTHSGLFTVEKTIMIIYGSNVGSSISTWFLASALRGTPRQLVMAQVLFNAVVLVILMPLFYLELYAGIPLVKALVFQISDVFERQMALVYIIFNLTGAIALSFAYGPYARMLEYFWPPTPEEEWSKVKYLSDQALKDPDSALALLDKEQTRFFGQLPKYIEELRVPEKAEKAAALSSLNSALATVSGEIDAFISELLLNCGHAYETYERVLGVKKRQDLIAALNGVVFDLSTALEHCPESAGGTQFKNVFLESMDTILLIACEAFESSDQDDIGIFIKLTSDRGDMMQNMRRNYLSREENLSPDERMTFLEVTSLFERAVWILARIAHDLTEKSRV